MSRFAIEDFRKKLKEIPPEKDGKKNEVGFLIKGWANNEIRYGVNPSKKIFGKVNSKEWLALKNELEKIPTNNNQSSGWFVLLGYDCARAFENLKELNQLGPDSPDFWAGYFDQTFSVSIDSNSLKENESPHNYKGDVLKSQVNQNDYESWVQKTIDYVYAGDVFQANIAQSLKSNFSGDALSLFEAIDQKNPSPYSGFIIDSQNEVCLVSNSPELLFDRQGDVIRAKPIAGTRRRGRTSEEDQKFKAELKAVVKEQAEHLMLVDLARNDIGRVAEFGSVKVQSYGDIESYQNVHHLVSTVVGQAKKDINTYEMLRALFPGGTITGAPKIRSIEIINELETHKRNYYTGSMGWINSLENQEWNILIRSAQIYRSELYLNVGAGIVSDSIPAAEYKETLNKASSWQELLSSK